MGRKDANAEEIEGVMGADPLAERDEIMRRDFYRRSASDAPETGAKGRDAPAKQKVGSRTPVRATKKTRRARSTASAEPKHYKIISISLYNEDLERVDEMVAELKRRGYTKANRSALIRYALDTVDLDGMPKGY